MGLHEKQGATMMRNRVLNRCFSIFAIFLTMFYTCGFSIGPIRVGADVRAKFFPPTVGEGGKVEKDPLLPFILPDKKISEKEFEKFIDNLDAGKKAILWKSVTGKIVSGEAVETSDLIKELHWASSHWIAYKFGDFNYHDMVVWTAKKLDIPDAICENSTTFKLEHMICEKMFAKMWDKLTPSQREEALKEADMDKKYATMSGAAVCSAISATLLAGGVAASTMGFAFYILMAKTVVVLATAVGFSAAGTITTISVLCGPVGWIIAGGTAITAALLLGRADVNKCISAVVQVHIIKINAMLRSQEDVSRYL